MVLMKYLTILSLLVAASQAGHDNGPGDPDYRENEGDLESAVNPREAPRGNYNILEDEGVYVLTRDTFAHFVKPKEFVLVEFYAPWCGHCKTMEPEYAKAAQVLREEGLVLAKVDATKEVELAKEHFVQGFPTLLLFKNGEKVEDYEGGRTSEEIVEYMRRQADPNWKPPPSAVLSLSQDNFTRVAKSRDLLLVMFSAPWCKHCKQLEPEFEGAAVELESWGVALAKVDGTKEKELADQFGVGGWPTLKIFRRGRPFNYNGPREKVNIIRYMKEQKRLPSQEKNTATGITNNMDRLEATVVGFFSGKSDLMEEYMVAANEMRGTYRFLHTENEEIAAEFGVKADSVVVFQPEIFWSPYENRTQAFTRKTGTYNEIIQFIRKHGISLVGQRKKTNEMFKYLDRPLMVIYYDVNYDHQFVKDTQFVRNKVLNIAKHFADSNLRFAISNEDEYLDELKSLGLEDSGSEVNVACFSDKQKFRMNPSDDFESEDLADFIEALRTGKVKPYMKSLPVPKKQEGAVRKIVANNYDDEIHKVKKDAVVFVFAPWCGHCKEFDPVFKKVAKKMTKSNENIVFGKLDGTANDIPYFFPQLKGYPSVFFISAYEKYEPMVYTGEKSYKALKQWIDRHSSIFLTEEEQTGEATLADDDNAADDDGEDGGEAAASVKEDTKSFWDEDLDSKFSAKREPSDSPVEENIPKDEL